MRMIIFAVFGAIAVGMSALYTLFHKHNGYKALLVRGLFVLSALALALVGANLNSLTSTYPLLIYLGLSFILLSEAMIVCPIEEEKNKMIVFGVLKAVAIIPFGLSCLTLASFNLFALGGGILLGLGIGCIICAIKKYKKWYQVLSTLLIWVSIGFMAVQSAYAVLFSSHMLTSYIMAGAGGLLLVSQLMRSLTKDESKIRYIVGIMYSLAMVAVACSIYFY